MKRRPPPRGSMLVLAMVALFSAAVPAQAAVSVNTTTDAVVPEPCLGAPGDCSLRQALAVAPPGESVIVPAGTYSLTLGSIVIAKPVRLEGAGARSTSVILASNATNAFEVESPVPATISGMTISAGHLKASGFFHGGAVFNAAGSSLTLESVSISGTTLEKIDASANPVRGAGIANNGTLTISNSTVGGNAQVALGAGNGSQGAGLFNSGGAVVIVNSTIANNSQTALSGASSSGAAIANVGLGTVQLSSVTIAGNSGSAALANGATMNAINTIVANGSSGNCAGAITSLGHNLESADECGFNAAGDLVAREALLGPLGDNGGQTDTVPLLEGSPAIDAADAAACLATDQRGVARPQRSACDIGAFELEPPRPAALPSNAFRFGKLKRNKQKGTALLTVVVPGPGTLTLTGKGVVKRRTTGNKLLVKAKGKSKRKLGRKGKAKVRLKVTFRPDGGTPNTKAKTVKLIKRR
jgi:hypothetical protein